MTRRRVYFRSSSTGKSGVSFTRGKGGIHPAGFGVAWASAYCIVHDGAAAPVLSFMSIYTVLTCSREKTARSGTPPALVAVETLVMPKGIFGSGGGSGVAAPVHS